MMLCYKQMAAFLFLLPFPTATPLFMMLFTTAMVMRFRPCKYCVALMGITYLATCNSSFFHGWFPPPQPALSTNFTSFTSSPDPTNASPLDPFIRSGFKFNNPVSTRCWGDLNGGKLLWPVLDGYQLIDKRRAQRKQERTLMLEARRKDVADRPVQEQHEQMEAKREESKKHDDERLDLVEADSTPTTEQPPQEEQVVAFLDTNTPLTSEADTTVGQAAPAMAATRKPQNWFNLWSSDTVDRDHTSRPPTPVERDSAPPPVVPEEPHSDGDTSLEPKYDASSDESAQQPPSSPRRFLGIPLKRRYDLRVNGIGLVVDFGPGRSEEAVKQEVEEWIAWEDKQVREAWEEADYREREREKLREERKRKAANPESVQAKRRLRAEAARAIVSRGVERVREVVNMALPQTKDLKGDTEGSGKEKVGGQVEAEVQHRSPIEAGKALVMGPWRSFNAAVRWMVPANHLAP